MSPTKNAFLVGTLAGALLAPQIAAAAEEACLQRNRLVSWRAVDDSTLEMTDRNMSKYIVRLARRCTPVTRTSARLVYRTWTNLSCLRSGEVVTVLAPGGVRATCPVAGVEAPTDGAAPAPAN